VLVTHDAALAANAQRRIVLQDGRVIRDEHRDEHRDETA
jgi:predicted ABC-type transport system involved in lysophospholipase L1 biosynthesis ATPase subunit